MSYREGKMQIELGRQREKKRGGGGGGGGRGGYRQTEREIE